MGGACSMNWCHIANITLAYNCQKKTTTREFMCTKWNEHGFLEKHHMKIGL